MLVKKLATFKVPVEEVADNMISLRDSFQEVTCITRLLLECVMRMLNLKEAWRMLLTLFNLLIISMPFALQLLTLLILLLEHC